MALQSGDYCHNETDLYRFECFLDSKEGVVLENARTNELISIPLRDFVDLKLEKIEPLVKGTEALQV